MKKNLRRVSVTLNTQTIYHLEQMAAVSGYNNIGRVIDKLTREKMLTMRDSRKQKDDFCVCCGEYIPEGRMICPACEGGRRP